MSAAGPLDDLITPKVTRQTEVTEVVELKKEKKSASAGVLVLAWIITVIIVLIILYALSPSFVCSSDGQGVNQFSWGWAIIVAVVIGLIVAGIVYAVMR